MGNSTSIQRIDTSSPLPNDLFELSDLQLKVLWENRPLALQEIYQQAKLHQDSSLGNNSSNSSIEPDHLSGLYYRDQEDVNNSSPESLLAMRLSQILSELALLRFRLVPSRLKEDRFWIATLDLLKDRLIEFNGEKFADRNEDEHTKPKQKQSAQTKSGNAASDSNPMNQVRLQRNQILRLKQQIQLLEEKLQTATMKKANNHVGHIRKTKASPSHKGSWKMSSDSQEFLQYPEEVKATLRAEKQKRLEQVRQEMRFILDSDEIQDSNGKWTCCDAKIYSSSCTKNKTK